MTNKDELREMSFRPSRRQIISGIAALSTLAGGPVREALAQKRVIISEGDFAPLPVAIPNFVAGTPADAEVGVGAVVGIDAIVVAVHLNPRPGAATAITIALTIVDVAASVGADAVAGIKIGGAIHDIRERSVNPVILVAIRGAALDRRAIADGKAGG